MPLFDRYVAVDWSAAARPKQGRDSIWIADRRGTGTCRLTNPATRSEAWTTIDQILDDGDRTLIGIDVSLGHPSGSSRLWHGHGEPWRSTWTAIAARSVDDDRNRNNRFAVAAALNDGTTGAGPFWGCPKGRSSATLRPTKPASFPVPEFRAVERRLRQNGYRPASCWQLLGVGSVGGQSLTAIPGLVERLGRVEVWPFTTGLRAPDPTQCDAVVAEVWPSLFVPSTPTGAVRDAIQVEGTVDELARADEDGRLVDWFAPAVQAPAVVTGEEGWILGVV